jgi:hypothetical protein
VHEDVLPPVLLPLPSLPLITPPLTPSPASPSPSPLVHGVDQQHHWLSTLALMRQQPSADLDELSQIESHITQGVSLPFISIPSTTIPRPCTSTLT